MKTVKNYTYILLLAVVVLFTSCVQDDEVAVAPRTTNIQVIVESFVNSQIEVIGQTGTNNANIELGFRLTEHSTSHFGSDIIIYYDGGEYVISPRDLDGDGEIDEETKQVLVGVTNIEFELEPPGGSIPYDGISVSRQIDFSANFDVEVKDRPGDLVVLKSGSITVSATMYGQLPPVTAGQVSFLFDWSPNHNGGNDLDLRLRNSVGTQYEYSGSVTNYEDVSLLDSDPDDDYTIFVDPWSTIGGTISGIMFAMHPSGTLEVFEMDLTGISGETAFVSINKSTDAGSGEVTYVVTQD